MSEELIKVGTETISQTRDVMSQMAEVAVPRGLFQAILERMRLPRLPEAVPR